MRTRAFTRRRSSGRTPAYVRRKDHERFCILAHLYALTPIPPVRVFFPQDSLHAHACSDARALPSLRLSVRAHACPLARTRLGTGSPPASSSLCLDAGTCVGTRGTARRQRRAGCVGAACRACECMQRRRTPLGACAAPCATRAERVPRRTAPRESQCGCTGARSFATRRCPPPHAADLPAPKRKNKNTPRAHGAARSDGAATVHACFALLPTSLTLLLQLRPSSVCARLPSRERTAPAKHALPSTNLSISPPSDRHVPSHPKCTLTPTPSHPKCTLTPTPFALCSWQAKRSLDVGADAQIAKAQRTNTSNVHNVQNAAPSTTAAPTAPPTAPTPPNSAPNVRVPRPERAGAESLGTDQPHRLPFGYTQGAICVELPKRQRSAS
uniref:Uncharacterized protein n=1 Tax=Chrysotila carterae TaxID=13221 RepID=A0A6S9YI41_CHRCT